MIICKKCGSECPDGNIFCEKCGAELETPVLPENVDSKGRMKMKDGKWVKDKKDSKKKAKAEKPAKKPPTEEQLAARSRLVKIICAAAAVIIVIVLIAAIYSFVNSNKGYTAAAAIPVGRSVDFAESETHLDFVEQSSNGFINSMGDFDYICISEDNVRVSGSPQPKWVIMLQVDENELITEVEYYDFTQLKLNWKGRKMAEKLTEDNLVYGMGIKNVNKTLGLKPYYIKRSVSNDSIYCYRYYYTDTEAGFDRAYNYYVDFSDIEQTVRTVHYREIEYARTIFNVQEPKITTVEYVPGDIDEETGEETAEETEESNSTTEDTTEDE